MAEQHVFKKSLGVGALGELLFQQSNPSLERLDGYHGDFIDKKTGEKTELKTDTYAMAATPNFFMELYSDKHKLKEGGPWQARGHECTYYSYFYIQDLTLFTFKVNELIIKLEELRPSLKKMDIPNKAWITQGLLVPRELLKDIWVVSKVSVKMKEVKNYGPK
jgi:hypothetical protein